MQSHVDLVLPLLHCYMDVTWVVLFGVTQSVTFALLLEALARSVRAAKPAVFSHSSLVSGKHRAM
jgi:hypothetical protein